MLDHFQFPISLHLPLPPYLSCFLFLLLHRVSGTTEEAEPYTPPAPGIPPPVISFIDPEYKTPGTTDNYTLSFTKNITLQSERDHIQEHLEIPLNTSQMTENELQFHYFKMYDTDKNRMLDGIEISKTIVDQAEHIGNTETGTATSARIFTDDELIEIIDSILSLDDRNKDGFVDYYEFHLAQLAAKHGS